MSEGVHTFQDLEISLREALAHLYDPDYEPPGVLFAFAGSNLNDGPGPVQTEIIRTIQALEPDPETPRQAESGRTYRILHARYVLRLTLEETAERLNLSVRHVTRLQREAVHSLARTVWDQKPVRESVARRPTSEERSETRDQHQSAWRDQVREELAVLDQGDLAPKCSLAVAVPRALRIAQSLAEARYLSVSANAPPLEPVVLIHPSALQHILLSVTDALSARTGEGGRITWRVEHCALGMQITISARPAATGAVELPDLVHELLLPHGGTATLSQVKEIATVVLKLPSQMPSEDKVVILAVDDNSVLVSLFQSYCSGTRYSIVHVAEGRRAAEAVRSYQPKAILLDVLLPDVDGWALLVELRQNPASCDIPIILCSVTRDESLALDLGASLYLPKPVWRDQLLEALGHVLTEEESVARRDGPSKPTASQ